MLFISLGLSAVLLLVVNLVILFRGKEGIGTASMLSTVAIIPAYALTFVVLALNALLIAVAGGVCWILGARPRWFLPSSLGATQGREAVCALT
jgi:hypothetical protein